MNMTWLPVGLIVTVCLLIMYHKIIDIMVRLFCKKFAKYSNLQRLDVAYFLHSGYKS